MPRPRRALLAAALVFLLAACGGGAATQGSVRDDVKDALLEQDGNELSEAEATAVGDCVARGVFESGEFDKDERDDVTRADDGDEPDPDLVAKLEALIDGCRADPDGAEG
jgi:hypothetical protein